MLAITRVQARVQITFVERQMSRRKVSVVSAAQTSAKPNRGSGILLN